jgi:hypothetical protein
MNVTFVGGPKDGLTMAFAHGDTVEFPSDLPPVIDFSVQTVDPIRRETHLYRRSLRNPAIFVYQP